MTHPQPHRIAAVFGTGQGSGYLLTPRLVLTAAHLLGDLGDRPPEVVVPGGPGRVACTVLWSRYDPGCDAALLLARGDLVPAEARQRFEALRWARIEDLVPRAGAHAVGFPHVQRDAAGELDSEQLVGTLKPGAGLLSRRPVLDSVHGAPAAPADGGSPWAGYSGSAVFVEDRLAGVVRADPGQWQHGRVEFTPATAVLDAPGFLDVHAPAWSVLDPPAAPPDPDDFEQRLREYLVRQSGALHIIGLSRGSDEEESWPLGVGYLSLELVGGSAEPDPAAAAEGPPQVQRAEQALAGHRRALIRGAAGSGKTTLLNWLSKLTADRALPAPLAGLDDCVPLLIRLRSLPRDSGLPSPEEFLSVAAKPLAGHTGAAGWVTRQLARGRILLLVDGVDEVPEPDRNRTRAWLLELLAAYPDARVVVTTRPSAVPEGWLARGGFTELELMPMNRADVTAFIDRWHRAAGTDPRLAEWRDALTAAVVRKQDLGRLAVSPLMCALICALNRDRRGYLPEGRMELYSAALEMLLVRRDRERGITSPDGFRLTADQQIQLLQRLAYWLVTNGSAEIDRELAVRKLEDVLPAMSAIRADGEEVLRHLLVRSGVLRQPSTDSVDFVHRTFQDYLAAKAAIEEEDLGVLVRNAHDDQWEDVLRMAVGHARPKERAKLLRALLARAGSDPVHGSRLRLTAAACLEHATELDPAVRQEVSESTASLIPPRDDEAAKQLATVGPVVLDLLPGPEGLDSATAKAVVVAASLVADARAVPLLAQYADHPSTSVRGQLAWNWDRFDTRQYGEQVIARLSEAGALRFIAKTREQLAFLAEIGGRAAVECSGPLPDEDLALLPREPLTAYRLHENPYPVDLGMLADCPRLDELHLINCTGPISLRPLAGLRLELLVLVDCAELKDPEAPAQTAGLRMLRYGRLDSPPLRHLPDLYLPPSLESLEVYSPTRLHGLESCLGLRSLRLNPGPGATSWAAVGPLPRLDTLTLTGLDLTTLRDAAPQPSVRGLSLYSPSGVGQLGEVARVFPGLRTLELLGRGGPFELDLLAGLSGCEIAVAQEPASPPERFVRQLGPARFVVG